MYGSSVEYASSSGYATGMILYSLICIIAFVMNIMGLYRTFEKAGYNGLRVLVPILNTYTTLEIGGKNGWLALLLLVPYVGWAVLSVFCVIAYINIAKAFDKSPGFVVGLILLPPVFWWILGHDREKYNAKAIKNNTSNRAKKEQLA